MPSTRPSREAVALLREWLEQLEGQVSVNAPPEHKAQQSAEEHADQELATSWTARHRSSFLRKPQKKRKQPGTPQKKRTPR